MTRIGDIPLAALRNILGDLRRAAWGPLVADALQRSAAAAGASLEAASFAEIPALSDSANPAVVPAFRRHIEEALREVVRLVGGGETEDLAFVRAHARLSAEHRFPLEAILHVYRCAHRIIAHWLRQSALEAAPASAEVAMSVLADFAMEFTNGVSTVTTSEYVMQIRRLAEAESDLRTELHNCLLTGYDESDPRAAALLRGAGYLEQRQSYCVAVARSVNASEMENPARAHRVVAALIDAVNGTSIRTLGGVRGNVATVIFSDRRRLSGWTAPQRALADRLHEILLVLGPSVLIGVSADQPSTGFIPKAFGEASVALDLASIPERVVSFARLPLRTLLVHHGAQRLRPAAPGWVEALIEANVKAGGALVETLRAIADADLNIQEAARKLGRHPNTVYARIARIRELTGLDAQRFHDVSELALAADCWRLQGLPKPIRP